MTGLAKMVRDRREAKTWTQDDLAEAMGVSRGYIGQVETGLVKRPRPKYRALFQKVLQIGDQEWLQAIGDLGPPSELDLMAEIQRIGRIEDVEDRIVELDQLPPEVLTVMETLALRMVRDTFRPNRE